MKKFLISLLAVLACAILFAGCDTFQDPDDTPDDGGDDPVVTVSPLEEIAGKYASIADAKSFVQTISVVSGALTQFESTKTYEKSGDEYTVTGSEKKLNDLTADTAYAETTISETVKAGQFDVKLKFEEAYFSSAKFENGVFEGTIKDGSAATALGITGQLTAAVHDLKLKISTAEDRVTRIDIDYVSSGSDVVIAIAFSY